MAPTLRSDRVIAALVARAEAGAARDLARALQRLRDGLPLSRLEAALLARNADLATDLVGWQTLWEALTEAQGDRLQGLTVVGWDQAAARLPSTLLAQPTVRVSLGAWTAAHPDALAALARARLDRLQGVVAAGQTAVREVIERMIAEGLPPKPAARAIREIVGLTRQGVAAVARYTVQLQGEDRPADQVGRMVQRYADRLRRERAETIARTEAFAALNEGKRTQWQRLQAEGTLEANVWERVWVTADDERTCPICVPLDATTAPIGGTYPDGRSGPPAHPRCRCVESLRLRGFRRGTFTRRERRETGVGVR